MEKDYYDPELEKIRDELNAVIKKYNDALYEEDSGIVLGALVVWETTVFNSEGQQQYRQSNICLDPSSLTHSLGLAELARSRLTAKLNGAFDA